MLPADAAQPNFTDYSLAELLDVLVVLSPTALSSTPKLAAFHKVRICIQKRTLTLRSASLRAPILPSTWPTRSARLPSTATASNRLRCAAAMEEMCAWCIIRPPDAMNPHDLYKEPALKQTFVLEDMYHRQRFVRTRDPCGFRIVRCHAPRPAVPTRRRAAAD